MKKFKNNIRLKAKTKDYYDILTEKVNIYTFTRK